LETYLLIAFGIHAAYVFYTTISIKEIIKLTGFERFFYFVISWFIPLFGAAYVNQRLSLTSDFKSKVGGCVDNPQTYRANPFDDSDGGGGGG
jgi:hypothetical protein